MHMSPPMSETYLILVCHILKCQCREDQIVPTFLNNTYYKDIRSQSSFIWADLSQGTVKTPYWNMLLALC